MTATIQLLLAPYIAPVIVSILVYLVNSAIQKLPANSRPFVESVVSSSVAAVEQTAGEALTFDTCRQALSLGTIGPSSMRAGFMIRLRVQEVAQAQGMSMRRLARTAGIAYNTLRTIYRDPTRKITTETLERLAKALNVPASDLIEDIPD